MTNGDQKAPRRKGVEVSNRVDKDATIVQVFYTPKAGIVADLCTCMDGQALRILRAEVTAADHLRQYKLWVVDSETAFKLDLADLTPVSMAVRDSIVGEGHWGWVHKDKGLTAAASANESKTPVKATLTMKVPDRPGLLKDIGALLVSHRVDIDCLDAHSVDATNVSINLELFVDPESYGRWEEIVDSLEECANDPNFVHTTSVPQSPAAAKAAAAVRPSLLAKGGLKKAESVADMSQFALQAGGSGGAKEMCRNSPDNAHSTSLGHSNSLGSMGGAGGKNAHSSRMVGGGAGAPQQHNNNNMSSSGLGSMSSRSSSTRTSPRTGGSMFPDVHNPNGSPNILEQAAVQG